MKPRQAELRSIPAWAGETYVEDATGLLGGVYPRVGGETVPGPDGAVEVKVYPRVGGGNKNNTC